MTASACVAASALQQGRSFDSCREEFDAKAYLTFERVLPSEEVEALRRALDPHLEQGPRGRNDFEGIRTNRVCGLLAKSRVLSRIGNR
jgi:hypothetical protein